MAVALSVLAELRRALPHVLMEPDASDFDTDRLPFIARFDDVVPAAIVFPETSEDAACAVRILAAHRTPFAVRAGGHSAAGWSSTRGVLIDLRRLTDLTVGDGRATVGAGWLTGPLNERLIDDGVFLPVGSCPTVGVAGLTLGGGFGFFGRAFGFTADHLIGAEAVLADGRIVRCAARSHSDLFDALRGSGGGLALVTALEFRTRPAEDVTIFELDFAPAAAPAVLEAWQAWAPSAPAEVSSELVLEAADDVVSVTLTGVARASESRTRALLKPFLDRLPPPPRRSAIATVPLREALRRTGGGPPQTAGPRRRQGYRVMHATLHDAPLTPEGNEALARTISDIGAPGVRRSVELAAWGGAYGGTDAAPIASRSAAFSLQVIAMVPGLGSGAQKQAAHAFADAAWAIARAEASPAVYANFPDPDHADWASACHGPNLARLRATKALYDPDNLFRSAAFGGDPKG